MQTAAPKLFLERSVALKHRPVRALLDEVLEVDEQASDIDVLPPRRGVWWGASWRRLSAPSGSGSGPDGASVAAQDIGAYSVDRHRPLGDVKDGS